MRSVARSVRRQACLSVIVLLIGLGTSVPGQTPTAVPDPDQGSAQLRLKQQDLHLVYQRVRLNGRTVGVGRPRDRNDALPLGGICRLGFTESALLQTAVVLVFPDLTVPAGAYTVFVKPDTGGWVLIFNKDVNRAGPFNFNEVLGTTALTVRSQTPLEERLTLALVATPDGGRFSLAWGDKVASADFRAP